MSGMAHEMLELGGSNETDLMADGGGGGEVAS